MLDLAYSSTKGKFMKTLMTTAMLITLGLFTSATAYSAGEPIPGLGISVEQVWGSKKFVDKTVRQYLLVTAKNLNHIAKQIRSNCKTTKVTPCRSLNVVAKDFAALANAQMRLAKGYGSLGEAQIRFYGKRSRR